MIVFLLLTGALALVVTATVAVLALWLLAQLHELDVISERLAAEQRIEHVTRQTLRAMRDAVRADRA